MKEFSLFYPEVKKIASHYAKTLLPCLDMDDLISAGMVGLLDAERKYDPNKGASFKTYSYIRINGEIRSELRKARGLKRSQIDTKREVQIVPLSKIEGTENEYAISIDVCLSIDIKMAFRNLSEQERLLIEYSYLFGLSQAEIGKILNLGEQKIGIIHRTALKKMAEYLTG